MKKNRISYNWLLDAAYTFIWTIILVTLFVVILQTITHPGKPIIKPLIAINGLFVPIATLFIGLRPVLSLFTIPDTLFINDNGKIATKEVEIITNDDIQSLEINQIGAGSGHIVYYEMTFKKEPASLKNKKRKSLILIERYNIKYIFQTRTDLIDKLIKAGLDERKIKMKPIKTKHFWGIRDKFKK